jgi:hypothetical protein
MNPDPYGEDRGGEPRGQREQRGVSAFTAALDPVALQVTGKCGYWQRRNWRVCAGRWLCGCWTCAPGADIRRPEPDRREGASASPKGLQARRSSATVKGIGPAPTPGAEVWVVWADLAVRCLDGGRVARRAERNNLAARAAAEGVSSRWADR